MQVVGHTIQEQGINSACAEQVFRIDVGMSKGCGNGEPEVMAFSVLSARTDVMINLGCFAVYINSSKLLYSTAYHSNLTTCHVHVLTLSCITLQVLEIINDSAIRRLHEPRKVNQGEPKAPDTPQGESTKGPAVVPWQKDRQQQPFAVQA